MFLKECHQKNIRPTWDLFHKIITEKKINFSFLTEKQLSNKIIDYRKIYGSDKWPSFKRYTESLIGNLYKQLFKRSEDSFFLAIEIYNRIKQRNRIEAFCILIINAFELLFKGYLVKEKGEESIYYDESDKTISINTALKKILPNEEDIVRKNIEMMINLRDQATHLLIPEIQSWLSRLFQASIFNYLKLFQTLTNKKINLENETGLISFIVDKNDFSEKIIEKNYGKNTKNIVLKFIKNIDEKEKLYSNTNFIIPVEYKLVLTKNTQEGDITLQKSTSNNHEITQGLILEVPKDPDKTHPLLFTDILKKINFQLDLEGKIQINSYSLQSIIYNEKIQNDKSNKYHFLISKPKTHKYSELLFDMIYKKMSQNENYLEKCASKYRKYLKQKTKEKKEIL